MEGVEALMRHVYVFPLVGLVLGCIFSIVAFLSSLLLPANLTAIVVIVAIYWLCGINHLDGLADFGDGVIAHGSLEKKIQAMKDVHMGTGGGLFITLILLCNFTVISSLPSYLLPLALVAGEVSAKQSMITFAAFSKSLQKGFGQIMIERTSRKEFLIGLGISAILCAAILGLLGLAMLAVSSAAAYIMVRAAKRNFGGATGDGIGATNEICRAISLSAALVLGGLLPWGGVLHWMPW
jgi:adenosylcobinamide-GDP ribazoletransferase